MINKNENPVEWSTLLYELDDVVEHSQQLIKEMTAKGTIDEINYKIQIAHIYAHLNRAWNTRNQTDLDIDLVHDTLSYFPKDIEPL